MKFSNTYRKYFSFIKPNFDVWMLQSIVHCNPVLMSLGRSADIFDSKSRASAGDRQRLPFSAHAPMQDRLDSDDNSLWIIRSSGSISWRWYHPQECSRGHRWNAAARTVMSPETTPSVDIWSMGVFSELADIDQWNKVTQVLLTSHQ